MSTHEPTPTSPDGQEPLSDLFSDVLRLANQVAARISQDEVEARLRRVLRRSGHSPAGADNAPLMVPFDPAAAEDACRAALSGGTLAEPAAAQVRELQQAIAGMRHELMTMTVEAQRALHLANTARAQAEEARAKAMASYAEAAKVMSEAREYHDGALERAAAIVKDAKATAEDIVRCAWEAASQRADAFADEQSFSLPYLPSTCISEAPTAPTWSRWIQRVEWDDHMMNPAPTADTSLYVDWMSGILLGVVNFHTPELAYGVKRSPRLARSAPGRHRRWKGCDLIQYHDNAVVVFIDRLERMIARWVGDRDSCLPPATIPPRPASPTRTCAS